MSTYGTTGEPLVFECARQNCATFKPPVYASPGSSQDLPVVGTRHTDLKKRSNSEPITESSGIIRARVFPVKHVFRAVAVTSMLSICSAQTALPPFEVTSIRPNHSGEERTAVYFQAGRFVAENASLKMVIAYAYNVKGFQISGGPSWIDSEKFNITAMEEDFFAEGRQRLPWKQYREQLGLMVQSLLADRFNLRVIHQRRELPILALVTAKDGPKMERSVLDTHSADIRGRRGQLLAKGLSLAQLADFLSWMPEVGIRKVVDQTGIEGTFDLSLRWTFEQGPSAASPGLVTAGAPPDTVALPDASGPSIFTALQEQLGLKLDATKGPVEFLVIDHIDKPSEN
jgi:uncharacterized protein (TIGR03435 family)